MPLYLIRHAQSENNALAAAGQFALAGRTADPALTATGEAQARCVAEHLRRCADKTDARDGVGVEGGYGIDRLYSSPMLRALQTAQAIAQALELTPEIWLDVHEEGGIWVDAGDGRGPATAGGLTRSAIQTRMPEFVLPAGVTESGWWKGPAETRERLIDRAERVAIAIRQRIRAGPEDESGGAGRDAAWHPDERIAIVSHGTFLSFLVQHLLSGGPLAGVFLSTHNTGITRLDIADGPAGAAFLRYQNRVDHLPNELVT